MIINGVWIGVWKVVIVTYLKVPSLDSLEGLRKIAYTFSQDSRWSYQDVKRNQV